MSRAKKLIAIGVALTFLIASGCAMFTRTIYVPHGQAVRLRETIKDAKVWVMTPDGVEAGVMDIPEGWYAMPDPGE